MRTISFSKNLINLDGTENQNQTLSQTLAEIIGSETKGNIIKLKGWYTELKSDLPLILDEADSLSLINLIESNDRLFMYVKWQLLEAINTQV